MISVSLCENGLPIKEDFKLPFIPRRGEIISLGDYSSAHYYVLRVEYRADSETVKLHVREFPNQVVAVNNIEGFRNTVFTGRE